MHKYGHQIAYLDQAIKELEADLSHNPDWQGLQKLISDSGSGVAATETLYARLRLENALWTHAIYRARVRLIEAKQMLLQATMADDSRPEQQPDSLPLENGSGVALETSQQASSYAHEAGEPPCFIVDHSQFEMSLGQSATLAGGSNGAQVSAAPQGGQPDWPPDDLTRIRGITPALCAHLHEIGVTRFQHIAGWDSKDCERVSQQLNLDRAIRRQNWISQAALLAVAPDQSAAPPERIATGTDLPEPGTAPAVEKPVFDAQTLIKTAALGVMQKLKPATEPRRVIEDASELAAPATSRDHQGSGAAVETQNTQLTPQIENAPAMSPGEAVLPLQSSAPMQTSDTATTAEPKDTVRDSDDVGRLNMLHAEASSSGSKSQHPTEFTPKFIPEPRLHFGGSDRMLLDGQRHGENSLLQSFSPRTDHSAVSEGLSTPRPLTLKDLTSVTETPKTALVKDKLRFRRIKPKSKPVLPAVSKPAPQDDGELDPPPLPPSQTKMPFSSEPGRRQPHTSDPNVPPPLPVNRRQGRSTSPPIPEQHFSGETSSGTSRFGDGQHRRSQETLFSGPVLDDDYSMRARHYGFAEEASVEIVRPGPNASTPSLPGSRSQQTQPDDVGPKGKHDSAFGAKAARPAKRILKALKRE